MEEHDKLSKLTMWSKIKELISDGLNYSQISGKLKMDRHTVSLYDSMTFDEFVKSRSYNRLYSHKLDMYEDFTVEYLRKYPFVSAAQVHDRLREHDPNFKPVSSKTVYNFVQRLRLTYEIPKEEGKIREMNKVPETDYGKYAQVDFGEGWMTQADNTRVKVYFFVMVLCRSRYKFVYFSKTPFTSVLAIYAHQLAFQYFGCIPEKIVYDQDKVFIHDENLGDYKLTTRFRAFVSSEGFDVIFCRKSDPQSKGKVENAVRYIKHNFMSAREYKDIASLNTMAVAWLERTANGTEHHGIRKVPAEEFAIEKKYMRPYTGQPILPEQDMEQRVVRQDNTIMFDGCFYSVPSGTYRGRNTLVYVEHKDGIVNIYASDSGKTIATHPYSRDKGAYVRNFNHQRHPSVSREDYRKLIQDMLPKTAEVETWLNRMEADKKRYTRDNLRILERESYRYDADILTYALRTCLEAEVYNARILMDVAEGERIRQKRSLLTRTVSVEDPLYNGTPQSQIPEKSKITTYDNIIQTAI